MACYCKLPAVTLTSFPIDSPDTTTSTRLFSSLPEGLSFEATDSVLPKPVAVTEFAGTPCCTRSSRTAPARSFFRQAVAADRWAAIICHFSQELQIYWTNFGHEWRLGEPDADQVYQFLRCSGEIDRLAIPKVKTLVLSER